ncbi:hypothetical protein AU210_012851 [Fusarium oxysporum f. sp. radicis-cucumerinum]|uniref:LysM domain-containing protein n=1 Tax=Fusarium oxysporum f. sp. radicis-cucumerinum TaxID=327505 RepID=A0A2H3GLN4_FUSOX|nr:hypothetical protein AU210_012851 [Fusarium oxysporum f. sp. radicis-cucumerinum]
MTYYGHNVNFQQQNPGYNQDGSGQGGYGGDDQRRNDQGGYQQGGPQQYGQQQGGYQQGGPQQGGYQQDRPGLSQSYYSESSQSSQYPPGGPSGPGQYQQGPPAYNQGPQGQFDGGDGPDGERGVMGALAGGAAGAFGGHKMGGVTGHSKTSTIERRDDDRYESHHYRRRSRSRSSSRGSNRRRGGHYAGNFTASSRDIRLDAHGDYVLHASCKREDGDYQHTSISLDKVLENDRGSFRWSAGGHHGSSSSVTVQQGDTLRGIAARFNCSFEEIARHNNINNPDLIYPGQTLQVPGGGRHGGGGFGSSARHVRLVDGGQRLEGELSRDGDWVLSSIILDERIRNFNGTLELV